MTGIRSLIVDDEPLARSRIRRLVGMDREIEIVAECANGREAVEAVRKHSPDLLILDVQMPELDGFGVLARIDPEKMPAVIFVTAFDQYAVQAFEVHALDYVLKPFDADRFRSALQRAKTHIGGGGAAANNQRLASLIEQLTADQKTLEDIIARSSGQHLDRLMLRSDGRVFFVKVDQIDWIEAAGNYVRIHAGSNAFLLRETMNAVETRLDPERFLRIHRSTIVQLDRVREMQPWFSGEYVVIMKDGTQLKLSRGYRDRLPDRMGRSA
ncbi:MAG: LytR/AlgR family response regulator transcription factor [Gemmatimonadaceae bacterium]